MRRIYDAKEEICMVKLDILTRLQELALDITYISSPVIDIFYKALSYVSYDMEENDLKMLLEEVNEFKSKIVRDIKKVRPGGLT